ncbi:unnamed protein product [Caenorhabditis auriculariae]|uniref:Uncharacterized protein n=1 Tax=Caenorhabditis auriculariae TaxID=2777116 RepID=A0A8S1HDD5_9PELO|nr:unnamed protein product [Caenorhabditis auriculariae]
MTCGCNSMEPPPPFELPPPPDPSLIWHLVSEEPFQQAEECKNDAFLSILDIGEKGFDNSKAIVSGSLIALAVLSVLLLVSLICCLVRRIRRKMIANPATKTISSDAILVSGENLWTYNSMKTSRNGSMGVLMYTNSSNAGSRHFQHTPATIRSYISGTPIMSHSLRHSESTTLRLHPNDASAAYHTVGRHLQSPPSEHYEEIPALGSLGYMPARGVPTATTSYGRKSLRKPPPSSRPPPPPVKTPYSPPGSDCSSDKELTGISSTDSPPLRKWEEAESSRSRQSGDNGRESGYGTTPSLQWRSPSGSARDAELGASKGFELSNAPHSQSMTYV